VTYDRIGIGYSKYRRSHPRLVDAILRLLDLPPGSTRANIGTDSRTIAALLRRAWGPQGVPRARVIGMTMLLKGLSHEVPKTGDGLGVKAVYSRARKLPLDKHIR